LVAIGYDVIGDHGVEFDLDEKISWAVEEPARAITTYSEKKL
jgi:hypothetical protein